MSYDAGFGAALTLRESLLKDSLLSAYTGGSFPHWLKIADMDELPAGPPRVQLEWFLGPPDINCHANNTFTVSVGLWGDISLGEQGAEERGRISGQLAVN